MTRLLVALALLLAAPAAAHGATAQVVQVAACGSDVACGKGNSGETVDAVSLSAGPFEGNRVTIDRTAEGELVLRDDGAPLTPGPGCRGAEGGSVRCPPRRPTSFGFVAPDVPSLVVALGDGNDAVELRGSVGDRAVVDGGSGDDRLVDATGAASLVGGPGDDALVGGPGDDALAGGPGDDAIDGGDGSDLLSYSGQRRPVRVEMGPGRTRSTSGADTFRGVERVLGGGGADTLVGGRADDDLDGGEGDDVLTGGGGADELSGGPGSDRLSGGAGADRLIGDPPQGDGFYTDEIAVGRDVLLGGAGNDVVVANDGLRDRIDCGAGRDRAGVDAIDRRRRCDVRAVREPETAGRFPLPRPAL